VRVNLEKTASFSVKAPRFFSVHPNRKSVRQTQDRVIKGMAPVFHD